MVFKVITWKFWWCYLGLLLSLQFAALGGLRRGPLEVCWLHWCKEGLFGRVEGGHFSTCYFVLIMEQEKGLRMTVGLGWHLPSELVVYKEALLRKAGSGCGEREEEPLVRTWRFKSMGGLPFHPGPPTVKGWGAPTAPGTECSSPGGWMAKSHRRQSWVWSGGSSARGLGWEPQAV